ncbi:hypothetical protein [Nitrosomonas sp.]|uniref:hypothetical protein n=1 Tax=Nitrosomonas sp. TaxID=42353 RepID=UPI002630E94A|nr:hypothetical protein [Nitrosomonas sp.]MBE7526324.1 hypothetical protein [Burkholderiales bacterium]
MLFYKGAIIRQFPWLLEPNKALDTGDFICFKTRANFSLNIQAHPESRIVQ